MKKIMIAVFSIFVITACSEEVKTVDWYLENKAEREARLKKCEVTQGSKQDQNCINAGRASYKEYMKKKLGPANF